MMYCLDDIEEQRIVKVYQLTKFHPETMAEMDDFELKLDTLWEPNPTFASLVEAMVAAFSIMDAIMEWQKVHFGPGKGGWCTYSPDGTELFIHEMDVNW